MYPSSRSLLPPIHHLLLCLLGVVAVVDVDCAVYSGPLTSSSSWVYLNKFSFSPDSYGDGVLELTAIIIESTDSSNLTMLIYIDDPIGREHGLWQNVYMKGYDCQKMASMNYTSLSIAPGINRLDVTQDKPYFWYVVLANCDQPNINVEYYLHMTNPGGPWFAEFSYDEQGVVQYYIFFLILYFLLVLVHARTIWTLMEMDSLHPIVRIMTGVIGIQFVGVVAETIHYCLYLKDGVGLDGLRRVGDLFSMVCQVLLIFLCFLVAKGWYITTFVLTNKVPLFITHFALFASYLAVFVWDLVGKDPSSTIYMFDSIPGVIVCVFHVGLTGWFLYCLRYTIGYEIANEKKRFYTIFGFFYTAWLLFLPAIIVISIILEPWYRFRTINGIQVSVDFLAFVGFVWFLWPTSVISYFNLKTAPPTTLLSEDSASYGSGYSNL